MSISNKGPSEGGKSRPERVPPQPAALIQEGSLQQRVEGEIARGQKALREAEKLRAETRDISRSWSKNMKEAPGDKFTGGETVHLTADYVNVRDSETGRVRGTLRLKDTVKIAVDPKRVEANGVVFVTVQFEKNGKPQTAYIAERYLEKTVPQTVSEAARKKEKVEIPEGEMLEATVLWRAARQFPDASAHAMWAKFVAGYKARILDKNLTGNKAKEAELALYKSIFGAGANFYEDKIEHSFELAAKGQGKLREEAEVVQQDISPERLERAFTELLGKLGFEIGTYYGMGPMTGEQIREAFGFQNIPHNRIGEKGTAIIFNYQKGQLAISIPAREASEETIAMVYEKATRTPGVSAAPAVEISPRDLNIHYKNYAQMQGKRRERFAQKSETQRRIAAAAPKPRDEFDELFGAGT